MKDLTAHYYRFVLSTGRAGEGLIGSQSRNAAGELAGCVRATVSDAASTCGSSGPFSPVLNSLKVPVKGRVLGEGCAVTHHEKCLDSDLGVTVPGNVGSDHKLEGFASLKVLRS